MLGLLIYWAALTSWFQKDDFAWLGLRDLVTSGNRTLAWALFHPLAEGTIRTLSERAFFMSFTALFGLRAFPFHAAVFLTYFAALIFVILVGARLTGSRSAGLWGAILWTLNAGVAVSLSWVSAYNEILEAFTLLLSFWLLLRYVDTGQTRYYIAQWITFVLGFGVLELNIVYPAVATVFALCCARQLLPRVFPLFAASALYAVLHLSAAPLPTGGPYQMHWGAAMATTLRHYWKLGLGGTSRVAVIVLSLGLLAFLLDQLRRREWIALLSPAWFLITIAPVLPIRDNMNDYYLTIPSIGLAMWGASALVSAWNRRLIPCIAAIVLLGIYVAISVPTVRTAVRASHDLSLRIRGLILGTVETAQNRQRTVLLKGVRSELFWSAIVHHPFRLYGMNDVYLVPEDRPRVGSDPRRTDVADYFIDPVNERRELDAGRATVLDVSAPPFRNITVEYRASLAAHPSSALSASVDLADPLATGQLGQGWYEIENGFRWMPKTATVVLPGPRDATQKLHITGFCPAPVLKAGPVSLQVSVEGEKYSPVWVRQPDAEFTFEFDLPARLLGQPRIEVTVEIDHTLTVPGDPRQLGMPFTRFEIR